LAIKLSWQPAKIFCQRSLADGGDSSLTSPPRIEHVTDKPSRLQLLHFARRVVVQQARATLAQIDDWIAAEERRAAERRLGEFTMNDLLALDPQGETGLAADAFAEAGNAWSGVQVIAAERSELVATRAELTQARAELAEARVRIADRGSGGPAGPELEELFEAAVLGWSG
jgi:hypothetical protein